MGMAPLCVCQHLHLSYDGLRDAVDDVSFQIEPGSVFALVGPNGAGKTSTLRMLATLQPPTSGRLYIDGIDVVADPEGVRRKVGYLPDNFALYDHQTPVEYLEFFARLHGVSAALRRKRIDQLLEEFDLGEKRSSAIRMLSRGMRQRLGVAKTLIHDPKLVLLDEPASALDPGARLKLKEALLALKRRGLGVLISSHILPDLADLADAVGIMEGGRMVRTGSIAEVATTARGGQVVYALEVENVDKARRVFADFGPRLGHVEEDGPGRLLVTLSGGDETVADLVDALALRGARIRHVAPRESALEAVYRMSAATAVA